MNKPYTIAVIPGDGIGQEVMPQGLLVLQTAAQRFGIALDLKPIEWASCDYYQQHGLKKMRV
jgi:tartrate dehydrogenase/decarboxylase/D-malate dehydrogenase